MRPDGPFRWHFVAHHLAHAASAFHASPFEQAAVMTLDGRGEKATTGYAVGRGTDLEWLGQVHMPHSLGLLYEEVTDYLGFLRSSDEYKVMALASFGKPRLRWPSFARSSGSATDGQYTIEPLRLEERFGPARQRGGPLDARHFDIASSLQVVLEETVLELARWLHRASGCDDLCMAGGVALNCVMNARVRDRGPFRRIWVQPAAGDAGTALGAALWIDARERGDDTRRYTMDHAYLGPSFSDDEIETFLRWSKLPYRRLDDVAGEAAEILARDRGHRLVPGPDGVRPAGPGRALDPGLADPSRDAGPAQRDQGPRGLPSGRAGGAGGGGGQLVRRTRTSRRSCSSSTTSGPRRPTGSRPSGTPTARRGSRRSTGPRTRSTTT